MYESPLGRVVQKSQDLSQADGANWGVCSGTFIEQITDGITCTNCLITIQSVKSYHDCLPVTKINFVHVKIKFNASRISLSMANVCHFLET